MASVLGATTSIIAATAAAATLANVVTTKKYSADNPLVPQPNMLSSYATYNYIISLGVLTANDVNNPDSTYMAGKQVPLICKSANADPFNRIKTVYGKFDFFIDNLQIDSLIGFDSGHNSNATTLGFDIVEPHSMGMFMIACQQAAYNAGHLNWHDAPFLLKIEFRGNKVDGSMLLIPNATRYVPFKFSALNMKVTHEGAKYSCQGYPWAAAALTQQHSKFTADVSIQGKTVKEMLQTGERSLQVVLNEKLEQAKKNKQVGLPDKIVILFPDKPESGSGGGSSENGSSATTSPSGGGGDVWSTIKVKEVTNSETNSVNYEQTMGYNDIGSSDMNFDATKKAATPIAPIKQVYDETLKGYDRSKLKIDYSLGQFQFVQGTDVFNAINQVLLQSKYVTDVLEQTALAEDGFVPWFRIDTQVFLQESQENYKTTGLPPKVVVYRIVPYNVHIGKTSPPNVKPPGYDTMMTNAVKVYNYIFTGKNSEVINFNINYESAFMGVMAADNGNNSIGEKTAANVSGSKTKSIDKTKTVYGQQPSDKEGANPSARSAFLTNLPTDGFGGGGPDTAEVRAAKLFHHVITNPAEMTALDMEIWGDPYFFAQSGLGNYTSKPTGNPNLNKDGTVNWQNGEVDIVVNFRTPIDTDMNTGLMRFGGGGSAPVIKFSGLYQVTGLVNKFQGGKFTQVLTGIRRPLQEDPRPPAPASEAGLTTSQEQKPAPAGDEGE